MSYRTRINGVQIFGNNEYYPEWIEFIQSQGIKINEEGSYEGEITDFMSALITVEKITLRLNAARKKRNDYLREKGLDKFPLRELFDFSNIPDEITNQDKEDKYNCSLSDRLFEIIRNGYAFMPYALYLACKNKLEPDKPFTVDGHFHCFKVKEGQTIKVSAR